MIDIKLLRHDIDFVKMSLSRRGGVYDLDGFLKLDKKRRELLYMSENLKNKQNEVSKKIPGLKKEGKDISGIFSEMKEISESIKKYDDEIRKTDSEIEKILLTIPNIPNENVPDGNTDDDNVEVARFGEPREFKFEPKAHWDIGQELGILDSATAAKVTGARFTFYKDLGARLERAVVNFFLDTHTKRGYTEVFPPFLVHRNSMIGTGQLPKFEEDAFKIAGSELFLIPTAEVPITNMFRDQILDADDLPKHYVAYSACFRSEAGAAGRDTRGLIRQHQFNKVELVKFCEPENSYDELEKLTEDAQYVLKLLELPYRVVKICIGDLGFAAAFKYDIEVWMPSYNRYVEISSCSNFEDFQARRAGIKYKKDIKSKAQFVHTLNGSGVAVGRTVAAILENYQNNDGSVSVPEILIPYMGTDIIK
ncbi:MAG: serine--tRNA ligase [Oscillospiraceae bacterium]|nr:serine--tRNA ligase [Oscillospiraceae bacterium]